MIWSTSALRVPGARCLSCASVYARGGPSNINMKNDQRQCSRGLPVTYGCRKVVPSRRMKNRSRASLAAEHTVPLAQLSLGQSSAAETRQLSTPCLLRPVLALIVGCRDVVYPNEAVRGTSNSPVFFCYAKPHYRASGMSSRPKNKRVLPARGQRTSLPGGCLV